MGTEQQQEFHSEKQTTKQRRKYIPFTDLSIKNWKPKNDNSWSTKTENREQIVRILTYLLIAGMIYLLWLSY